MPMPSACVFPAARFRRGPDDVEDDAALVALGDDAGDVTQKEDGDGEEN